MSIANRRIAAGLEARKREATAGAFKFEHLARAPKNPKEIHEKAVLVLKLEDQLREASAGPAKEYQETEEKIIAKYAEVGKSKDEKGVVTDQLGAAARSKLIKSELGKARRSIFAKGQDERTKMLRELRQLGQDLEAVSDDYSSPVAMINLGTLSDPVRATYAQNLVHAGPKALEGAFRRAVVQKDYALAAAAMDRYEGLDKAGRQQVTFARNDAADALVGQTWRQVIEILGVARIAVEQGNQAVMQGVGAKLSASDKIRIGIMRKNLEAKIGRPIEFGIDKAGDPIIDLIAEQRLRRDDKSVDMGRQEIGSSLPNWKIS